MNRHHAIDIDERAATWRSSGWTPRGTTPTPAGTRAARSDVGRSERAEGKADADVQRTQRVPIAEEQALFVEEIVIDDRDRQRQQPGQQTREFRDEDFRDNYNTTYAKTGMTYDQVRPAYQYGTELAADQRYRGKDWSAFESDARRDWDSRHPGASTWDKVKAGVRHAWERTKAKVS